MKLSAAIVLASTLCLSSAERQDRIVSRVLKKGKGSKKLKSSKKGNSSESTPAPTPEEIIFETSPPTPAPTPEEIIFETSPPTPAPTPEEITLVESIFKSLDTNVDGFIGLAEFLVLYLFYKREVSEAMATSDFESSAVYINGLPQPLDLEAFSGTGYIETLNTFNMFDVNGDDVVSDFDLEAFGMSEFEIWELQYNVTVSPPHDEIIFRDLLWFNQSAGSFQNYDQLVSTGGSSIDLSSYTAFYEKTTELSETVIDTMFQDFLFKFDITNDQSVDALEWIAGNGYWRDDETLAQAEAFIARIDGNGDGLASPEEITYAFGLLGVALIDAFDFNVDGKFGPDELDYYYKIFYGYVSY